MKPARFKRLLVRIQTTDPRYLTDLQCLDHTYPTLSRTQLQSLNNVVDTRIIGVKNQTQAGIEMLQDFA